MRFVAAGAAFSLLNLALSLCNPLVHIDPSSLPHTHTWEWWRTQSFVKYKQAPNIVLLGSSLIMIPVSVLDADYLGKDLDAVQHDRSVYMENQLARLLPPGQPVCFNLALPGAMISDQYMIVRSLMNNSHHPDLIVVGVTLRDFIESHVYYPACTSTFSYFRHFGPIDDIVDLSMPECWQKIDFYCSKYIYLLNRRLDLQALYQRYVEQCLESALAMSGIKSQLHVMNAVAVAGLQSQQRIESPSNLARSLKDEVEVGDFILPARKVYPYVDNSNEYRKRFSHPNAKLFQTEFIFLQNLLALAKTNGSSVLIVNMPLTKENMALTPGHYYDLYRQDLVNCALQSGCPLLDLNDGKTFSISDFRDTAHMNAAGGKKLIDAIVHKITSDPALTRALRTGISQDTASTISSSRPAVYILLKDLSHDNRAVRNR